MTTSREPAPALPDDLSDEAAERLLAAEGPERRAVLEALVAEHPEHDAGLRRLFSAIGGAERLLDGAFPEAHESLPTEIGGHRVLSRLGEGAFGIVFLCAQERPVSRLVAIKVLRPGSGDRNTIQRFESERQLLASLSHPAITPIYDAGHLPDGRPYFVMEYVDGLPLTRYCAQKDLDLEARLALFVELCRGVEHAHARGIVHRDLKPANVLVVDAGSRGRLKIIDFGIAKAMHGDATDHASPRDATETGRVLGTPGYMSPEQAEGRVDRIDERADVFALGVMLYELLTGELPWPRGVERDASSVDLPSRRIASKVDSTNREAAPSLARLAGRVRRDLDWITRKATARELERRYPSVGELADELERYQAGRPVLAGPATVRYRLAKYARRNRAVVLAIGVGLVGASAVGVAALWRAEVVEQAVGHAVTRAQSDAQSSYADASSAVAHLLQRANDDRVLRAPQSEPLRSALAADALGFYEKWLRERPDEVTLRMGRCRALLTLSQVHFQLGQFGDALRTADEARGDAQALYDERPEDLSRRGLLADALRKQARALLRSGGDRDGRAAAAAALAHMEACFQVAPAVYALAYSSALRESADSLRSEQRLEEALAVFRRSVEVLEGLPADATGGEPVLNDRVIARCALAQELTLQRQFDEADRVLAPARAELPRMTDERLRAVAFVSNLQGRIARSRGDDAAALGHWQSAAEAAAEWHREEPQLFLPRDTLAKGLLELAKTQERLGDWPAADATLRRTFAVSDDMRAAFPDDATRTAFLCEVLSDGAHMLFDRFRRADLAEAEEWARRAADLSAEMVVEGKPATRNWSYVVLLAQICEAHGSAAPELWDEVTAALTRENPPRTFDVAEAQITSWVAIAAHRFREGRIDDSVAALDHADRLIESWREPMRRIAAESAWWRSRILLSRGDTEGANLAVAELLSLRGTWWGKWRGGYCEASAWRLAESAGAITAASAHRDNAATLYRGAIDDLAADVRANPGDPWFVLPWGFASLGLAEVEFERGAPAAALSLLDAALPALERVEAAAHREQWDESIVRAGRDLRARLGTGEATR